jgi:hypothetical protein
MSLRYKQLWYYESCIVAMPTSTSASIVATTGWGLGESWRCWWAHSRTWCIATIIWSCAPLVHVTRVVALVAHHYFSSSFCFVHVVPNPLILPSCNTLAHFWMWIWYVHSIFLGILSKTTLHEVALNYLVPSVPNSFHVVVPRYVPTMAEILKCITYDDHMWATDE